MPEFEDGPRLCSAPLREGLRAALRPGHAGMNQKGGPWPAVFAKSAHRAQAEREAPPEPSKLLLLGFLCLLCLLRCLLLRFLSHSILFWVNGWKRDTEACSGRASLATASIIIRTDSLTRFPRCHVRVITLSTAVLHFDAIFPSVMPGRRPGHPSIFRKSLSKMMDRRIKSGDDAAG